MKPVVIAAGFVVSLAVGFAHDVQACGDKYIVATRTTRFDRSPALRQSAAILFVAGPGTELSRTLADGSVMDALRKVGYLPTIVGSADGLSAALGRGQWSLIVIDLGDLQMIGQEDATRVAGRVVPVSYGLTSAQWTAAKRQYPAILRAPKKARSFLDGLDSALETQRGSGDAKTRR